MQPSGEIKSHWPVRVMESGTTKRSKVQQRQQNLNLCINTQPNTAVNTTKLTVTIPSLKGFIISTWKEKVSPIRTLSWAVCVSYRTFVWQLIFHLQPVRTASRWTGFSSCWSLSWIWSVPQPWWWSSTAAPRRKARTNARNVGTNQEIGLLLLPVLWIQLKSHSQY